MATVTESRQDGIAIVKLNRGETNALNLQLVNELDEYLRSIEQDPEVRGLVLGSCSEKFFSNGFDVREMLDFPRQDFERFFRAFNYTCLRLYTLPKPTAAAITGHAVAGGCILALCCDYRLMADDRKLMGLNEVRLGVPVPFLPDCIVRDMTGNLAAREILEIGRFYGPSESLHMGLVDEISPVKEVLDRALEKVRTVGSLPSPAFALIKQNRTEGIEKYVRALQEDKLQAFIDCWYSDHAQALIREAAKKF